MMKLVTGVFSGLVLSQAALAEPPAVYQDGILTIHGGAVINAAGLNAYYHDIQLQADGNGAFRIIAVEAAELADVTGVEVLVTENDVEAVVTGIKSACVEIEEPAISYNEGTFIAVLPESVPDADVCILQETTVAEEYEYRFPVDVSGLAGGDYLLIVNGAQATFTIAGEPVDATNDIPGVMPPADDDSAGDDSGEAPIDDESTGSGAEEP